MGNSDGDASRGARDIEAGAGARVGGGSAGAGFHAESADAGGLTARQSRFVEEYLVDGSGRQAAIRAGYSARSAQQIGSNLLRKPKVAEALAVRRGIGRELAVLFAEQVCAAWRVAEGDRRTLAGSLQSAAM